MNYHNITHDDMRNGDGLRVVLWVSGCEHHCKGCQNPITWDINGGIPFDDKAYQEIISELEKDYISGITFSGGDPLNPNNVFVIQSLINHIHMFYRDKSIWIYTGYTWEQILNDETKFNIIKQADVLVDGKYIPDLTDINYPWAGSTNQRVIDIQKSIQEGEVVLYESR